MVKPKIPVRQVVQAEPLPQHFYGRGSELQMLEDAVEAADMAWWVIELPSGAVFFSPNKLTMLGFGPAETAEFSHYTAFTDRLHPDDYGRCMRAMKNVVDGRTMKYNVQYRLKHKNGRYVAFHDKGRVVGKRPDGSKAVAGLVQKLWNQSNWKGARQ